jgi:hypothetical protein
MFTLPYQSLHRPDSCLTVAKDTGQVNGHHEPVPPMSSNVPQKKGSPAGGNTLPRHQIAFLVGCLGPLVALGLLGAGWGLYIGWRDATAICATWWTLFSSPAGLGKSPEAIE